MLRLLEIILMTDGSVVAAWVQAFGSILAIVSAVWVVRYQHKKERALEKEKQQRADNRRVELIDAVIAGPWNILNGLSKAIESNDFESIDTYDREDLVYFIEALAAIPILEIPDPRLVRPVFLLRSVLTELYQFLGTPRTDPPYWKLDLNRQVSVELSDLVTEALKIALDARSNIVDSWSQQMD